MTSTLSLDAFLPYRLSFTSNAVSEQIAGAYRALFDLNIPEWRMIAILAEHSPMTQHALCARTGMDKVTISRTTVALVRRGLVDRKPNPGDGRSQFLTLTGAGRDLHALIVPKALELERSIFACLDDAEQAQLMQILARIDAQIARIEAPSV